MTWATKNISILITKDFLDNFETFNKLIEKDEGFKKFLENKIKRKTIKGNEDERFKKYKKENKLTSMKIRYLMAKYVMENIEKLDEV
ncbi:MAG: hypothetical protein AABY22_09740 [Nanoarchaeota archaeon]